MAWESEDCEKVVNAYRKKRYKDNRIKLPKEIESMIYLELANSFEGENEKENRQKWRLRAYDNSNNSKEIQALIQDCMDKDSIFDINAIWQIINKRFVRNIFDWYLQGMSLEQIKHKLEEAGIKTASGSDTWYKSVIQEMLCNEKYMGDSMLQKYFTEDYLSGKKSKNVGQKARYYVHDSHEGIISKEKFLEVACEMNRRKNITIDSEGQMIKKSKKYNPNNVLGNILECEMCGATFRRRTERGKIVYRCATRMEKMLR